jgi:SAM-dependent methyltransferase
VVAWYLCHQCPEIAGWVAEELQAAAQEAQLRPPPTPQEVRAAEVAVLDCMQDLLVYALDPAIYDAQPFLAWDSRELSDLVDFRDKTVLDVGAGTGRLAMVAAPLARAVFAVEPVANLRAYMRAKALERGFGRFYAVDGLITAIPFPDAFADVTLCGHVYGDQPQAEIDELLRVTRPGGMLILCPGNNDRDDAAHTALAERGFAWSVFEEPQDGRKRKYWKTKE